MPLEIKTSSFCGLSRSKDWQAWLKEEAPDLLNSLMTTIDAGTGCRANSNKMMEIYFELQKRNKSKQLETFLQRRFPWLIKNPSSKPKRPQKHTPPVITQTNNQDWDSLNKHKVFASYRPDILSFPRKLIIIDNPDKLFNRVQRFIVNKLSTDYLIIDNYAYIEYFEPKDAGIIDKIPLDRRDIYKYRQKMVQDAQ